MTTMLLPCNIISQYDIMIFTMCTVYTIRPGDDKDTVGRIPVIIVYKK